MKLRINERSESKLHEGDCELFSEPEYIGPYGDDGWETDDDDRRRSFINGFKGR